MEIAIVGIGGVTERNYIPSLLKHEDVQLTCYSRTLARAEEMGQKFGERVRAAPTLEALFERQPEAVLVLTNEERRFEATQALMPFKPKRLFFEKPLVARNGQAHVVEADFWDGKQLLQQAQEIRAETAMVFNYRFFDQTQRAKQIVQARNFGPLNNVVALSHYATWSHCIDLILQFGGPLRQISAQQGPKLHPFRNHGEAADVIASFLIGEQGTGTILGTSALNWGFPLFELILNFAGGRIHLRGLDQTMEILDYNNTTHEVVQPSRDTARWDKYRESFSKSVDAYLESIRAGAPPPVPGLAGLLELQFEVSLKKSIEDGCPVVPAEAFPLAPLG